MNFFLEFRLNACPICLACFECQSKYGKECICQAREIEWKRKKAERDYTVNFCYKPLTQKGATNQKVTLDKRFVDWLFANVSSHIKFSLPPNNVNICQDCMNKYRGKNKGIIFISKVVVFINNYLLIQIYQTSCKKQGYSKITHKNYK